MSGSPHETILDQMIALARTIEGVGAAMPTDGREPQQMAAEAARNRAAGATVFARILDGEKVKEAPRSVDRTELTLAWAIASPAMGERRTALETAYGLWSLLYASASGNRLAIDWLDRPLMYRDWALVYDSPNCAIVDLVMTTRYDLATIPDLPTGSPLPTPAASSRIQYSPDGETWSAAYTDGDMYARWSVDGGNTWGPALRFRGEDGDTGSGTTVSTDETITGNGSAESPLSVTTPYEDAATVAANAAHANGDGSDHADVAANTAASHTQGTDQALDTGGANEVSASQAKAGYAHSQVTTGNPHSLDTTDVGAEPDLGNPAVDGYVLKSTADGVRSWEAQSGGGDMSVSTYDPTTVAGDAFDMGNMAEAADAKILTAAERSAIAANSSHVAGDGSDHADVAANTAASHAQGTDQALDTGGANEVTAAQAKTSYIHSQITTGNPHSLDATDVGADASGTAASAVSTHETAYDHADIAANSAHAAGDGSDHADVAANSAASHAQGTDQALDAGGANEVTAAQAKTGYAHSQVTTGNPHSLDSSDVGADPAGTATSAVATHESSYAHSDIASNSAHRTGDGSDHADVAANSTHRGTTTGNPHQVTAAEAGADPFEAVSTLPASPTAWKLYRLTATDATAMAAPGLYRHDGNAWYCLLQQGPYVLGNLTGTVTLPNIFDVVYTGTTTGATSWTFPSATGAGAISLRLTNGGSQTQTWDADVNWPGGTAPTLTASGVDWLVFASADGTNWDGSLAQEDVQ